MLFRKNVSRAAAGKGRAVLEGVWLDAATIESCFRSNPLDEEAAVQAGLTKWVEGKGRQPPTWEALIEAMKDAEIRPAHLKRLKTNLLKVHTCVIEVTACCSTVTWWWEAADLLHMLHISCMEGLMLHCTVLSLNLSPLLPHSAATGPPLLNIC